MTVTYCLLLTTHYSLHPLPRRCARTTVTWACRCPASRARSTSRWSTSSCRLVEGSKGLLRGSYYAYYAYHSHHSHHAHHAHQAVFDRWPNVVVQFEDFESSKVESRYTYYGTILTMALHSPHSLHSHYTTLHHIGGAHPEQVPSQVPLLQRRHPRHRLRYLGWPHRLGPAGTLPGYHHCCATLNHISLPLYLPHPPHTPHPPHPPHLLYRRGRPWQTSPSSAPVRAAPAWVCASRS